MAKVPGRRRHVPQRTCVGCRNVEGKRTLVRVVRTPEGRIEIDPTGKRNGRGAYVHTQRVCWDAALQGALAHALHVALSEDDRRRLLDYIGTLDDAGSAAAGGG